MKKRPEADPDPEGVWKAVARTVKAYAPDTPKKPPATKTAKPAAARVPPVKPAVKAAAPLGAVDHATDRKIRRGREEIGGRLDMHGFTQDEAHAALSRFIASAHRRGLRTLLVITGKGKQGGGVLKRMLPLWLAAPGLREKVLAVSPAGPEHGGGGAFYVRLRKK